MEGFEKFGGIDGLIKRSVGSKSLVKCQSREETYPQTSRIEVPIKNIVLLFITLLS